MPCLAFNGGKAVKTVHHPTPTPHSSALTSNLTFPDHLRLLPGLVVMPSANDEFACFNKRGLPRGHFFSCRDLYSRGVWVGYLTPEKYGESYEGLASFNQLKTNCKRFSQPYPPTIVGVPGGERSAVCRGCVGSSSQLLTLRELSFVGKTVSGTPPLVPTFRSLHNAI